jgi:peroxiredoxin (alkyl hydroperoxide reductase subunit C)
LAKLPSKNKMLIQKPAPNFKAAAVMPDNSVNETFELYEYLGDSVGVVFFYPLDFTFVCPTEIIAFNHYATQFAESSAKIIGISVDSHFSHIAWKNTEMKNGGIGPIQYPLISDIDKSISRSYEVLLNESIAIRGTFIIDKNKIIRQITLNDLPIGRNIEETLRLVDAMQFADTHGEVCQAQWHKGDVAITPTSDGIKEHLSSI